VKAILDKLANGHDLTRDEARRAFDIIMEGAADQETIRTLLTALADKGEQVEEIVGAAEAMRARVTPIACHADCIDTCGTGGDGISTFNVSTTAAIIAAAAGVCVAKHGNTSNTRVSGSAEVLEELGVNVYADASILERCLRNVGIAFLHARELHPAMKHAAPVRAALKRRTIFNLLGPLTNPAGAKRQVLGVPTPELTERIATALMQLGTRKAWVVHGLDGLCDLTITAETRVSQLDNGEISTFQIAPETAGLTRATLEDLTVSSVSESAAAVRAILAGKAGPMRNHAVLNAAAAILVSGLVESLEAGVDRAVAAIDCGEAMRKLDQLSEVTHQR
jgi:anthranilate phosphoribosyltransferase